VHRSLDFTGISIHSSTKTEIFYSKVKTLVTPLHVIMKRSAKQSSTFSLGSTFSFPDGSLLHGCNPDLPLPLFILSVDITCIIFAFIGNAVKLYALCIVSKCWRTFICRYIERPSFIFGDGSVFDIGYFGIFPSSDLPFLVMPLERTQLIAGYLRNSKLLQICTVAKSFYKFNGGNAGIE
jgi:hypothetical protein